MTLSSVLLVLLQICSLQLMLVAMPTCPLEGDLVQRAHHLLRDLGGSFPVHCRPYNANISFPGSALPAATANHPECRQVLWVVYESLQEAGPMFDDEELPAGVTWDRKTVRDFRMVQDRLGEDGSCLSGVDSSGVLSPYFSNVTAVLQQQDGATCGLMALRRDLLKVLQSALHQHRTCFTWRNTTEDTRPRLLRKRSHAH
ncbi:interferon phi 2 [Pagrus major]|uniref:interferon phi 2 n=1 Tax=Pagrus major TaxID=143350 RepID=UPI003CC855E6